MFFCSRTVPTRNTISLLLSAILALVSFTVVSAQKPSETNSGMIGDEQIQGRIFFPPGERANVRPIVKLQSLSSPEITGVTDPDGRFRFTHLRPDLYTVIVDAGDQYEKVAQEVEIGNAGSVPAQGYSGQYIIPSVAQLEFYLQPRGANTATNDADAANLPAGVRDLLKKALANERAGDHTKSIEALKAVIAQAPDFVFTYNELGVEYLKTGNGQQAAETFKKALAIDPKDKRLRLNYGIALLNQKNFEAAETELRLAVSNNNADTAAGYYLGLVLLNEQKTDEAQSIFESVIKTAGDKLPLAHRYLGGIYWRNKKYQQAANELEI
jgi:tetratricopeptide (TPR) repeat protein